jgi:outer membrane protein assembly factor BamB
MKKIISLVCLTTSILILTACNRFGTDNLPKPTKLAAFTPSATTTKVWSRSVGSGDDQQNLRLAMIKIEDQLLTTDAKGHIEATNARTGKLVWKQNLDTPVSGGISGEDTLLAVVGENATLYILDQQNGHIRWSTRLDNQALATPKIANGKVFVKTIDEQVFAFDAQTGKALWTFASGATQMILRFGSAPLVVNNKVIIATATGKVFALNAEDGSILWEQIIAVPNGITEVQQMVDIDMNPIVEEGIIYVASYQGNLAAIELATGAVLWHKEFSSFTGLSLAEDKLYITDANSHLWCLDKASGRVEWKQDKLAYRGVTAPVLFQQFILIGDKEGYIHILSQDTGDMSARIQGSQKAILSSPLSEGKMFYILNQEGVLSAYEVKTA